MRFGTRIATSLLILGLTGCVTFAEPIATNTAADPTKSYVYGRFKIDQAKTWLGLKQSYTIGIEIKCSDDKTYVIKLQPSPEVQVVQVSTGSCGVNRMIFTDGGGNFLDGDEGEDGPHNNFKTIPGQAVYVGEYLAESKAGAMGGITWKWAPLHSSYDKTTEEMLTVYPSMQAIQTRNVFAR